MKALVLFLCLAMFKAGAEGIPPMIFGPEFTFTDLQTNNDLKIPKIQNRMRRHLVHNQPDGQKFTANHSFEPPREFTSPNGWQFRCHAEGSMELQGCVMEVQMNPATVAYFRQYKDDMQDAIFISAENEGMVPAMFRGGGHINFSMDVFEGNNLLLRNFLVDLINHDELFMGMFGYDTNNGISFQMLPEENQLAVYDLIEKLDLSDPKKETQTEFLEALQKAQNISIDIFWTTWRPPKEIPLIEYGMYASEGDVFSPYRAKYHAVNFNHVKSSNRIELRAIRPQASMDVWVRQIELIEHRMKYLAKIDRPIPILWKVPVQKLDLQTHLLTPPIDPQLALRAFYQYVTESGLEWSDYTDFLWSKWVADGEVLKFQSSRWFQEREMKSCAQNLSKAGA